MRVDGVLANLLQGISQQQPQSRLPGQCTDQVNAVNDVVYGWKRRPPTEYVAELLGITASGTCRWHFYDTGVEQYLICVEPDGTLHVVDLLGNPHVPVGASSYKSILSFTSPEDLSVVTIGDYTLFANSKIVPAMATGNTELYSDTALVYLRDGGEYGRKYTVSIDGTVHATYTAPGGSTPATDAGKTGTEYVATQLYNALVVNTSVNTVYSFAIAGSIIEVKRKSGTDVINLAVTDDRGGQFAKIIQREVKKAADLPKYATPGQVVKVTGDGTSDKDDYYLKFTIESGTNAFGTEGIWRECACPGVERKFDSSTMPHALIRMPDNTWRFTPLDGSKFTYNTDKEFEVEHWRLRSSGDEDSNKTPSFVGKPIVFMGTFQDRLYVLSDENAVFSATNSYFNYFNKTASTILDSDPVDMPSAGNAIAKLRRGLQHDRNLILFADKAQFIVAGTRELTPKSSMSLTTSYESDLIATPVPAGAGVLFPITYGDYAGVREFITTATAETNSSQPITAHIPKLIKGSVVRMVTSSNFDVVLLQSTEGTNRLYVYKYLWQNEQRQQASWGIWEHHSTAKVCTMFVKGAYIYVVLKYGNSFRLERMDLTDVPPDAMPFNVYLDSRVAVTPSGNTLTIPYTASKDDLIVVRANGCKYPGAAIPIESVNDKVITLSEVPEGLCYVGLKYKSLYTPTIPVIKDQNGGVVNNANFILSKFRLSYKDTGGFTATVTNPYYPDFVIKYSGRTLGAVTNKVGSIPVASGVLDIPVRKDAKFITLDIETDTHLPMNLTALEWEGDYIKRGRRL